MYSLHDITFSFGEHTVLDGITLDLSQGEVTALIGRNGSGKTTLLRIAAGELPAHGGSVQAQGERIGYLPQQLEGIEGAAADFLSALTPGDRQEALRQVGLTHLDLGQSVETLSGGEKTKLGLARILAESPTVLLLDEPTNNLDLEGLEWLAAFVLRFPGSILLTSHDRTFLDLVATRTVELQDGAIALYGGNYSFVRDQQKREREAYQARFEAQEKYKGRLQEDIATTKNQAIGVETTTKQVNIRRYAKKVARKAVVRQARLERQMSGTEWLDKPRDEDPLYLPLPRTEIPAGKIALEADGLSMHLGGRELFRDISFQLLGGQRLWLTGRNGSGKSTLLKILLGKLEADSGSARVGGGIRVGFFSQDASQLTSDWTAREELLSTDEPPTRCFQFGRSLGLSLEDLGQKVESLSRGQQAKLSFAKMLLGSPQLLILDEPTNHIELEAREALESALSDFRGTMVVASHDRYFVERLGLDIRIRMG